MKYVALIEGEIVTNLAVMKDDGDPSQLFPQYTVVVQYDPSTQFVDIGYLYQNGQFIPPEGV